MKNPAYEPILRLVPEYLADYDSSTVMLMALGNFLQGADFFSSLGLAPPVEKLAGEVHKYSRQIRENMYSWTGFMEAIPTDDLHKVFSEHISEWVVHNYHHKSFPAVAIGSASGAMTHLYAALGIPWLPQSFLIPVRKPSSLGIDEPEKTMEWASRPARILLENNPDLQLHHVFDPVYDRLMLQYMTHFRIKKIKLGISYTRFLKECLPPGGTIFVVDCKRSWPVTRVDNRHYFQFGSLGGANENEYQKGGTRIREFLKTHNASVSNWQAPATDWASPEGEWGFDKSLQDDIEQLARQQGYNIKRIVFQQPDHPSAFVADIYRWHNRQRNMLANRLVAGSFIQPDLWWTMRTGSVPFWMNYNSEASASLLEEYLDQQEAFSEIFLMLFTHGIDNLNSPSVNRWKSILGRAKTLGQFMGADSQKLPLDLHSFIKYNREFPVKIQARYPIPAPLSLNKLYELHMQDAAKYKLQILDLEKETAISPLTEEPVKTHTSEIS